MKQFAVKGVETLKIEQSHLNDDKAFEQLCLKYYEYAYPYCLRKEDREELHQKFKSELDIDIRALID